MTPEERERQLRLIAMQNAAQQAPQQPLAQPPGNPMGAFVQEPQAMRNMQKGMQEIEERTKMAYDKPEAGLLARIGARIGDTVRDPAAMARLAASFNAMSLNQSPQFQQAMMTRAGNIETRRQNASNANLTAQHLKSMGMGELGDMVQSNPSLAGTALQLAYRQPQQAASIVQEFALAKSQNPSLTLEEFYAMRQKGSGVTIQNAGNIPPGYRAKYDDSGNLVELIAVEGGPALAKDREIAEKNKTAFRTYEVAVRNLSEKVGTTPTGYFAGFLPAFTSTQQSFDSAVAGMGPILKGLFREAGEGVFTDKDQAVLEALIPTRSQNPDVAFQQLASLDRIVRAKLGIELDPEALGGPRRADYQYVNGRLVPTR